MPSCCVCVDEKSQIQALEHPAFPPPPRALPAGDIGAEQRLTGPVEGVADDRLGGGERPACPPLRKLSQ
jgi:hypothetical protein